MEKERVGYLGCNMEGEPWVREGRVYKRGQKEIMERKGVQTVK